MIGARAPGSLSSLGVSIASSRPRLVHSSRVRNDWPAQPLARGRLCLSAQGGSASRSRATLPLARRWLWISMTQVHADLALGWSARRRKRSRASRDTPHAGRAQCRRWNPQPAVDRANRAIARAGSRGETAFSPAATHAKHDCQTTSPAHVSDGGAALSGFLAGIQMTAISAGETRR